MTDEGKTKKQLINEQTALRQKVFELKEAAAGGSKAPESLQNSEEGFQRLFETLSDAVLIFNADTLHLVDANPGAERLYGYSREELLTNKIIDFSAEPELSLNYIKELPSQGKSIVPLRYHRKKDGSVFPVEITSGIYTLKSQKLVYAIVHDITARKRIEDDLRTSEATARTLLKIPGTAMMLLDTKATFIEVNETMKRRFCGQGKELTGRYLWDVLPPHVAELRKGYFAQALSTGAMVRWEDERQGMWNDNSFIPVANERGEIAQVIGFTVDITDAKQAARELEQYRKKLEELVERKTAELRESEKFIRSLIQTARDGFWLMNSQGVILDVNESYCAIIGYSRDELIGMHISNLETVETSDEIKQHIATISRDGYSFFETYHRRKDGSTVPLEITVTFHPETTDLLFAFMRDITARKKHEQQQREAKEFLDNVFTSITDCFMVTYKGKVLRNNPVAEEMLGYGAGELIGKSAAELIPNDEAHAAMRSAIMKSHATGSIIDKWETDFCKKDGGFVPVEFSLNYLKENGQVVGAVISARDITERRRTQAELQRLGAAIQQTIDGVAIVDLSGTIEFTNLSWVTMHGYSSQEELYGRHLKMFYTQGQYEQDVAPFLDKIIQHGSHVDEVGHVRKDGSTFPTRMTCTLLKDSSDNPVAMVAIARDITMRKEAEEKLRQEIQDRKAIERQLRTREEELREVNHALKVLLKRTEDSKSDIEEKILFNVNELVMPYFEKLRSGELDNKQISYLSIIEANLKNIISPFGQKLSVKYAGLTPSEIQIANLIREGKQTKNIAEMLGLSSRTVEFHRKNIREKLGINNEKANLRSLLLTL